MCAAYLGAASRKVNAGKKQAEEKKRGVVWGAGKIPGARRLVSCWDYREMLIEKDAVIHPPTEVGGFLTARELNINLYPKKASINPAKTSGI